MTLDYGRAYSNLTIPIKIEFTLGHRTRLQKNSRSEIGTRTDYVIKSLVRRKTFKAIVKQLANKLRK